MNADRHDPELISIITVVRNAREGLQKTIESVRNQHCGALEYIVIDGGSTDGTLDVIRSHLGLVTHWTSEPDRGISHAFNKGVNAAHGEIIGILNAGDWFEPDALRVLGEAARANPGADAYSGAVRFWEEGRPTIVCYSDPSRLYRETSVYHPAVFIRRRAYERFGLYDETYRYAMDYELLLRAKQLGAKITAIAHPLANVPLDGRSSSHWYSALREVRRARSLYFPKSDVWFHHVRAVLMNIVALTLKRMGLRPLYHAYWVVRNRRFAAEHSSSASRVTP